jgi:hypothetical protein
VLPAWDGSKTASAGGKPGFGWRKKWRLRALYWPYSVSETGTSSPAVTTKSFPTALVLTAVFDSPGRVDRGFGRANELTTSFRHAR